MCTYSLSLRQNLSLFFLQLKLITSNIAKTNDVQFFVKLLFTQNHDGKGHEDIAKQKNIYTRQNNSQNMRFKTFYIS